MIAGKEMFHVAVGRMMVAVQRQLRQTDCSRYMAQQLRRPCHW